MSGNALKSVSGRKSVTRVLTWTCLALIPVLAILTLSTGLLPALSSDAPTGVPGGLQIAETRALTAQGDDVASVGKTGTANTLDDFMNDWQNTVRRRPSPRR